MKRKKQRKLVLFFFCFVFPFLFCEDKAIVNIIKDIYAFMGGKRNELI